MERGKAGPLSEQTAQLWLQCVGIWLSMPGGYENNAL